MLRNHHLSERLSIGAFYLVAIVAAIVFATIFDAKYAHADSSKSPWSGCYVGAGVSYDSATVSVFGANGYGGSPFLGCDLQRDRFVFGLWGDYDWSHYTWNGASLNDKGWAAGGRVGVLIVPQVLAYGLVGYTQQTATGFGGSVDLTGMEYGGGLEVDMGKGWFSQLEAKYEPLDVKNSGGITAKVEEVRVGILYKFNLFGMNEPTLPFSPDRPLK